MRAIVGTSHPDSRGGGRTTTYQEESCNFRSDQPD